MTVTSDSIASDLHRLNVHQGDVLLLRANLGAIGLPKDVEDRRKTADRILEAILQALGPSGTLVSLAYTGAPWFGARKGYFFDPKANSSAGALPNVMLKHPDSMRSRHPTNSVVAIGPDAAGIVEGHDEHAPAYEPIRKLVALDAKMGLIGIVGSSPGFTTTHLAEFDLGLHKRLILPTLSSVRFEDADGIVRSFHRTDPGLCSKSFTKFYAFYVTQGILLSGSVGEAYSIFVPARPAYEIETSILKENPKFNICGSPDCVVCNGRRWDRLHYLPGFLMRRMYRKIRRRAARG